MTKRKPLNLKLRKSVLEYYNYSCQKCKSLVNDLDIHHIIPVKDGGLDIFENLIPLCEECHIVTHGNSINKNKEMASFTCCLDKTLYNDIKNIAIKNNRTIVSIFTEVMEEYCNKNQHLLTQII